MPLSRDNLKNVVQNNHILTEGKNILAFRCLSVLEYVRLYLLFGECFLKNIHRITDKAFEISLLRPLTEICDLSLV